MLGQASKPQARAQSELSLHGPVAELCMLSLLQGWRHSGWAARVHYAVALEQTGLVQPSSILPTIMYLESLTYPQLHQLQSFVRIKR